jgi:prophage regulatory protein
VLVTPGAIRHAKASSQRRISLPDVAHCSRLEIPSDHANLTFPWIATKPVIPIFSIPAPPEKGQVMSAVLSKNATLPETGFLRQPQVLTFVPISKSTLWRRQRPGTFPAPLKLSTRVTVGASKTYGDGYMSSAHKRERPTLTPAPTGTQRAT